MAKAKKKQIKKRVKTDWDPWYCKMLDAVAEYIENIEAAEGEDISERDHTIIRALVEFYGFDYENIGQILDDMNVRVVQLEKQKLKVKN